MTEHTPTPWQYIASTEHHGPYITTEYGSTIADLYVMSQPGSLSTLNGGSSKPVSFLHEMADPNAAFIVKACNSHDALVAALETAISVLEDVQHCTEYSFDGDFTPPDERLLPRLKATLARAATPAKSSKGE